MTGKVRALYEQITLWNSHVKKLLTSILIFDIFIGRKYMADSVRTTDIIESRFSDILLIYTLQ